ncbi:hypothetical protein [uncultured Gammaproteobacteria bacterium]|jgi:hypothetical protein|uniref:hypothetical protein n=1 Tax=thiotrophic endosymbiont of Bathymodiolus puteoserpentis (Logatchev) TaxID=343240 RepID=UPI0010B19254|nr:hypothetical protein [thiotrophic endosymbiont of Bathymodiolus puteoserpentis (Logatchev)]CAC9498971.1 hypothetical protein [uncultured Gammaproteobacteria bacterium]CAC9606228.1 hypothetical protein [uncultured Gammaproteobacteria bacterium]CAC9651154.1 hypothetical protein [uncultured Gammaproteobacteria bacterium]SSC11416.1 hypothetical protein BPUTEOSOX_1041 [thiotrophic endosymbiont of Bathymodiolus puteoserpentis (Logatchev)]VVH51204.1 hypothetical protein BPUTSESOX_2398 [uncultured 
MKNLDKYINDNYKLSLDEAFGYWIHNGIWYGDESLTFEETKEVFFLTLKKLLDDNKVVLCPPITLKNAPVRNQYNKKGVLEWVVVWDIQNEEIIQYMRDAFPKNVSDENDGKVYDFWFSEDCPQIGWVDQKTGEIVS